MARQARPAGNNRSKPGRERLAFSCRHFGEVTASKCERAHQLDISIERLPRKQLDELVDGAHQGVVVEMDRAVAAWDEQRLLHKLRTIDHAPLLLVLDGINIGGVD